jgi:hypothetical protein
MPSTMDAQTSVAPTAAVVLRSSAPTATPRSPGHDVHDETDDGKDDELGLAAESCGAP